MALGLSTSLLYDRMASRMSALGTEATRLQVQIATGKKIQSPSEDVAIAQQIAEFDRKDADAAVYKTNLTLAGSLLGQADSTLGSIGSQLQRAIELATQAGNGTITDAARKLIGDELGSILDGLVGLANTVDVRGQPLFGSAEGTPAVMRRADGSFAYNAAPKLSPIPIGDGQSVQPTETAARIFTAGGVDALAAVASLAEALAAGAPLDEESRSALDALAAADEQVNVVRASVGAREARVELQQGLLRAANLDRDELRSAVEDVDVTQAVTELQKTMTILQATQASFSKLTSLSLFDYLR